MDRKNGMIVDSHPTSLGTGSTGTIKSWEQNPRFYVFVDTENVWGIGAIVNFEPMGDVANDIQPGHV